MEADGFVDIPLSWDDIDSVTRRRDTVQNKQPVAYEARLALEMITMPSTNEPERFEFANNLIMEAGDLALQYFDNVTELSIMSKGARDMVSEADFAVSCLSAALGETLNSTDGRLLPDRCSHWLTASPTLDAIHGSGRNRLRCRLWTSDRLCGGTYQLMGLPRSYSGLSLGRRPCERLSLERRPPPRRPHRRRLTTGF